MLSSFFLFSSVLFYSVSFVCMRCIKSLYDCRWVCLREMFGVVEECFSLVSLLLYRIFSRFRSPRRCRLNRFISSVSFSNLCVCVCVIYNIHLFTLKYLPHSSYPLFSVHCTHKFSHVFLQQELTQSANCLHIVRKRFRQTLLSAAPFPCENSMKFNMIKEVL